MKGSQGITTTDVNNNICFITYEMIKTCDENKLMV